MRLSDVIGIRMAEERYLSGFAQVKDGPMGKRLKDLEDELSLSEGQEGGTLGEVEIEMSNL